MDSSFGRCHKRSAELQLPHLEAYARLALAKFRWQHCMRPAEPLDHLGNGDLKLLPLSPPGCDLSGHEIAVRKRVMTQRLPIDVSDTACQAMHGVSIYQSPSLVSLLPILYQGQRWPRHAQTYLFRAERQLGSGKAVLTLTNYRKHDSLRWMNPQGSRMDAQMMTGCWTGSLEQIGFRHDGFK